MVWHGHSGANLARVKHQVGSIGNCFVSVRLCARSSAFPPIYGSKNIQSYFIVASSEIGNIDQEFFLILNLLNKIVFWSLILIYYVSKIVDWKSWLAQVFLDVFLGLTLTGPKKASKSTILHNRLNKENKLLVKVANLATCCHDDYDVLLEVWEPCKCYVSSRLGLTTFPPTTRALAENDLLLPRFGVEVLRPGRVVFNARARWRKRCETKATTNIAFAQGSQTSNSTS